MRLVLTLLACLGFATGALAETPAAKPTVDALLSALAIDEVAAVMRDEGIAYGKQLDEDMLSGSGGAAWADTVSGIYSVERFMPVFRPAFEKSLTDSHADLGPMITFFSSDLGKKIVGLEVSARRAILDDAVKDASKLKVEEMKSDADPRLDAITEFVTVNDLIESNVSSGLNASYAFYKGLASSGAIPHGSSDAEILENVWAQEAGIRADTTEWIYSFLVMAYAPLSDKELADYIAFSGSPEGKVLNKALFEGFDAVFVDVSRQLGQAAASRVAGQDL